MNRDQAANLVEQLAHRTGGFDEDALKTYIADVQRWQNFDAAVRAVRRVCDTWEGKWRPAWGVLARAYRSEIHHDRLDQTLALPPEPPAPRARGKVMVMASRLMRDDTWIRSLYPPGEVPQCDGHHKPEIDDQFPLETPCPRHGQAALAERWDLACEEAERRLADGTPGPASSPLVGHPIPTTESRTT